MATLENIHNLIPGENNKSTFANAMKSAEGLPSFDSRLYRALSFSKKSSADLEYQEYFYPHYYYGSYSSDLYETPQSIQTKIKEAEAAKVDSAQIALLNQRLEHVQKLRDRELNNYLAPRSFIHPYALVKLAGASGKRSMLEGSYTYDQYNKRRFYEIDGNSENSGHYSKNPTTTNLIKWGNESERGKTPYSFQDFVFCKWWNKIENNRLITLRRYAAPVTDSIDFSDYTTEAKASDGNGNSIKYKNDKGSESNVSGYVSNTPWVPLATAVTYFGADTGNELSKILSFSAKYNWESKSAEDTPINVSSAQNDEGTNLVSSEMSGISSGLGGIAKFMGIFGEIQNGQSLNMDAVTGAPPDPYVNGPYENRILGPVNVIMDTYRRKRGLKFDQNGLSITFDYIARPIAGINNKAILLDLLSNILVLTYSSGSWFGGMWKYECKNPALYPWRYGDVMNKMHRGELFGEKGAIASLTKQVYGDGKGLLATFLPDAAKMIKGLFDGAVDAVKGFFGGNEESKKNSAASFQEALSTGTAKTIQKLIAAKATKGTTVPYLHNQRALLTGEPVGDWHLTIGNPLNPIAMIGNLVVTDTQITFSDELGPDDFPIGFTAKITLNHGLGRDRDAIESMFNRGYGRIYTLPNDFRSTADSETKIDDATGVKGERTVYDESRNTYYGGGTRGIIKTQKSQLKNTGTNLPVSTRNIESLKPTKVTDKTNFIMSSYFVNPWQMAYNM